MYEPIPTTHSTYIVSHIAKEFSEEMKWNTTRILLTFKV